MITESTHSITPPKLGEFWTEQGGVYAGVMRGENNAPNYHLIVPTDTSASIKHVQWADNNAMQTGAHSFTDGLANTQFLQASSINHPAAQWASELTIDGFNDFYLPAKNEILLAYITVPELFEKSGWYWTSTQHASNSAFAWVQVFDGGYQYDDRKSNGARARAVRRVAIA